MLLRDLEPLRAATLSGATFDYIVDMTDVTFISPPGMATLGATLCAAGKCGAGTILPPRSASVEGYLSRIDFYSVTKFQTGEYPFRRLDSTGRFLELIEVQNAAEVSTVCDGLVAIARKQWGASGYAENVLHRQLAEVIENAVEHGGSSALVCAQHYANDSRVEFAVADCGIGFKQHLSRNPALAGKFQDGTEAIELAMQPKVSGTGDPERGFGLFTTHEMVLSNKGDMIICSDDGVVAITHGKPSRTLRGMTTWPGSVLAVGLSTRELLAPPDLTEFDDVDARVDGLFGDRS